MVSSEMAGVIATFEARRAGGGHDARPTIDQLRADFSPGPQRYPLPSDVTVERVEADGVTCWWLDPPTRQPERILFYVHGGGWALGGPGSHGELAARLGRQSGARVLFVEYRLAPEHPYPAGLDDVETAWTWLTARCAASALVAAAGDSAGGNLLLAAVLRARDRGATLPRRIGLMSPATDLTGSGASMSERADDDPIFTPDVVRQLERQYLNGVDAADPHASPLFAALHDLPPMLVQTGEREVLYSDTERLVAAARAAGVHAELTVQAGCPHVYPGMAETPEALSASAAMSSFLFDR